MAFRVISGPDAEKPRFRAIDASSKPSLVENITGGLATLNRAIPLVDEAADGLGAFIDTATDIATGKEVLTPKIGERTGHAAFKKRYNERRGRSKAASESFNERMPVTGNLLKGTGLAIQAAPTLFSGGLTAAPALAAAARPGAGLLTSTARKAAPVIANAAKSSVAAGLGAQVGGLAGEGSLEERVADANDATVPAMVVGAALPGAIAATGAVRRKAAGAGQKAGTAVARIANRATGGRVLDAETEAAKRMAQALKADGLGPQEVRVALEAWQKTGASAPTLMDLAGENTRALLRAASAKPGAARNAAVRYADEVASDIQDNAIARTRALLPDDSRNASQLAEELAETQGRLADDMYAGPYAAPAPVSPQVMDALSDEPGKAALRRARSAAVARRNLKQVEEIDALLNADAPLDMSQEARMARANAQGFTQDAYHGTPVAFTDDFDISRAGSSTDTHSRGAIFATDNPAVANTYAGRPDATPADLKRHLDSYNEHLRKIEERGLGEQAYRSVLEERDKIAAEIQANIEANVGANVRPLRLKAGDFLDNDANGQGWFDAIVPAKFRALSQGAPGATVRNVIDPGGLAQRSDQVPATTYVITDPSRVRSRFDAFEPEGYRRPPAEVSGGTLDRVRIAMSGRAAKAQQSPDTRDIAGGLFSRAAEIDSALDNIPGLAPARATYRGMQAARDAVELGSSQPFNRPDTFADELDALTARATPDDNPYPVSEQDILRGAQVGLRSEMERMIGAPAEGSTGVLNRIATGTNPRRVLEEAYGLEDASLYRDGLSREIERLQNARFISPNTGSQTATRLMDESLVDLPDIPTGPIGLIRMALDKIRRGVTLTDAEREVLVSLGTRQIEPGRPMPDIPELKVPERLLTPAQRQRIARAFAIAGGSREATEAR